MSDFNTVKISTLPEAMTVSDNDCLLVVQNRKAKRARPSLMKGDKEDAGESAYLRFQGDWVQWKLGVSGSWQNLIYVEDLYGPSAYEVAVKNSYQGTEAEWVASLSEASEQAAAIALEAAQIATETHEAVTGHENSRVAAEKARVEAEQKRVEAEEIRILAENARMQAEKARAEAEAARVEAENSRVEAEEKRVVAEEKRQQDTYVAIEDANLATDRLNKLSDHREYIGEDGFWYRYNEETKEFENTGKTSKGNLMYATFAYHDGRLLMRTDEEYTGPVFRMNHQGRLHVIV